MLTLSFLYFLRFCFDCVKRQQRVEAMCPFYVKDNKQKSVKDTEIVKSIDPRIKNVSYTFAP